MAPSFRYIPVLGNAANADMRVTRLDGLSTRHGDPDSDRGTLYGSITGAAAGPWTVSLFADIDRAITVLTGSVATLGTRFNLARPGGKTTGPTLAVVTLKSYSAADTDIVVLPTFAVDEDVLLHCDAAAKLGGWDRAYGLAFLHVQAMREVLGSILPATVPHLYHGRVGLSNFVPSQSGPDLPDLRKLANAGQLREICACLVKAKGSEQFEHLEEYAAVAKAARERLSVLVEEVLAANVKEAEAKEEEQSDVGSFEFGTMTRG